MGWIGHSAANLVFQGILILVTLGFLIRQWRIHKRSEAGGAVKRMSQFALLGLGMILISEFMDFFVLQYEMPYFWVKLYSVTPQIGGILFVFIGVTSLLRAFDVL